VAEEKEFIFVDDQHADRYHLERDPGATRSSSASR
jgi:hypothetical protein